MFECVHNKITNKQKFSMEIRFTKVLIWSHTPDPDFHFNVDKHTTAWCSP